MLKNYTGIQIRGNTTNAALPLHSFAISLWFPRAREGLRMTLIRPCNGEPDNVTPNEGSALSYNCYMFTEKDRPVRGHVFIMSLQRSSLVSGNRETRGRLDT